MCKLLTIIGISFSLSLLSQQNQTTTIFLDVDTPAIYVGGSAALQRHISTYSNELKSFFSPGTTILISFIVEPDGSISNITPVNAQLPENAKQIIDQMFSTMNEWKPAVVKGKKIRSKNFITLEL